MRGTLAALGVAAAMSFIGCQTAGAAVPATAAIKDAARAATATSMLQTVQYRERRTRHGFVKCYREFVVGPYRCHRYRYW